MTPSSAIESVEESLNHFNSKILNVLNALAPLKVKTVSGKQKAP